VSANDPVRVCQQSFTVYGQRHTVRIAQHQGLLKFGFKLLDLLAQGRLGPAYLLCGTAHDTDFGDDREIP
jgi:hypothetical protein